MNPQLTKLIFRYRLLLITCSITSLFLGFAFVYSSLFECVKLEPDIFLATYSLFIALVFMFVSIIISINTIRIRKTL